MKTGEGQSPALFYRLGLTREKGLFKRRRDTYDGIVVPANIAAHNQKFCTEFLGALSKPYFIDPMTYIFARPLRRIHRSRRDADRKIVRGQDGKSVKESSLRRSFQKLIEGGYQDPFGEIVQRGEPLLPSDFTATLSSKLAASVSDFQLRGLAELPAKYAKYLPPSPSRPSRHLPCLVVAPYFYLDKAAWRDWLQVNVEMLRATIQHVGGQAPVYGVVFGDTGLLDQQRDTILEAFESVGPSGLLLWFNRFHGRAGASDLAGVAAFVKRAAGSGLPTFSLYGDYYQLLLWHLGLSGFACGVCYGERKGVDDDTEMEGSMPYRYYIPLLKKKVVRETLEAIRGIAGIQGLACSCEICGSRLDPLSLDEEQAKEHFLCVRAGERELTAQETPTAAAARLRNADRMWKPRVGHVIRTDELLAWARIIDGR